MTISQEGIDLIASFEGLSLKPYKDVASIWTIGYGSTYDLLGGRVHANTPSVSIDQAKVLLRKQVNVAVNAVRKYVTRPLSQHQFDALCSLTYNIGIGAFKDSTLLKKMNNGIQVLEKNFTDWSKARDPKTGKLVTIQGLLNRRKKEYLVFIS